MAVFGLRLPIAQATGYNPVVCAPGFPLPEPTLTLIGLAAAAAVTGLLAAVTWWFRRLYRAEHYHWWVIAAMLATTHYFLTTLSGSLASSLAQSHPVRLAMETVALAAVLAAAVALIAGALAFTGRGPVARRYVWAGMATAGIVAVVVLLTPVQRLGGPTNGFFVSVAVRSVVIGAAIGWAGVRIWRHAPEPGWGPTRLLAAAFLAIAAVQLHHLIYSGLRLGGTTLGYPIAYGVILNVVFLAGTAVAFVMVALVEERTRALASVDQVREAEAALRRQDRRFQSMIEHSTDIITVLDEDATIRYESPSITKVLGYSTTECVGKSAFDYLHPDDLEGTLAAFQQGLQSHESVAHRFRFRHKDGSWVVLEARGRLIAEDGEPPSVVINSRDVTDRDRLERQLLDAQKMESVGRLAGGVAHDFNNLLTVIKGNAQLALAVLPAGNPARAEIEDIQEAAERAAQLTRQLLTFARRQIVAPEVIDANEAVRRAERLLRRLIGENIQVTTELLDRAAFVRVDPVQLEQVVLNLAVNARDAMPNGGSLSLRVGRCRLDDAQVVAGLEAGSHVTISVIDTGVGISEDVRQRLFEPFFTTKALGAGTGLGLATSYGIVRQAGGAIEVDSEVGRGSWFTVLLPEVVGSEAKPAAPTPAAGTPGAETILVAEDDPAVRRLVVTALRNQGYRVLEAADGVEAQEIAAGVGEGIHLLVTDVVMPRMGGVELARRLRAVRPSLPVAFTTGYVEALRPDELCLRSALLLKPYTPDELARQVRRLLDQPLEALATFEVNR